MSVVISPVEIGTPEPAEGQRVAERSRVRWLHMFPSRRPRVAKLARKGRVEDLICALRYREWAPFHTGEYVDMGVVVRREAVLALAHFEDPRVVDALAEHSLYDADTKVQLTALSVLRSRMEPRLAPVIAWAFAASGDRHEAVRVDLADALRAAPSLTAAPVARALIWREGDRPLDRREEGLLRDLAGSGEDTADTLVREFVAALSHDRSGIKERAVQALLVLGAHSIPALIKAMGDWRRGGRAAAALGQCANGQAVDPLIELSQDRDPTVRCNAARALGPLRDPRSAQALFALTQDDTYEVRIAATEALDALGSIGTIVSVANLLRPLLEARGGRVELEGGAQTGSVRLLLEAPPEEEADPSRHTIQQLEPGFTPGRSARPAN